jgi:hypothetical protein
MFQILERGTRSHHYDFTSLFFRLKVRKQIKMYLQVCDGQAELHEKWLIFTYNTTLVLHCDAQRERYTSRYTAH